MSILFSARCVGLALVATSCLSSVSFAEVNQSVAEKFKQLQPAARAAQVKGEVAYQNLGNCIGNSKNGRADCPNEVAQMDQAAAENSYYTEKLGALRSEASSTGDTTDYRWVQDTPEDRTNFFNEVEEAKTSDNTQNVSSESMGQASQYLNNGSSGGGSSGSGGNGNSNVASNSSSGGGGSSGGGTSSGWKY